MGTAVGTYVDGAGSGQVVERWVGLGDLLGWEGHHCAAGDLATLQALRSINGLLCATLRRPGQRANTSNTITLAW